MLADPLCLPGDDPVERAQAAARIAAIGVPQALGPDYATRFAVEVTATSCPQAATIFPTDASTISGVDEVRNTSLVPQLA